MGAGKQGAKPIGAARILVVDDEPHGLETLARVLRPLGRIEVAPDGASARRRLETEDFDVVLSDQRMPGISGVDLLGFVAQSRPEVGRILLTGYADLAATIEAINRGRVDAYLTKPCSPDDLRIRVAEVLERVRLLRENGRLLRELRGRGAKEPGAASEMAELARELRAPVTELCEGATELARQAREGGKNELEALAADLREQAEALLALCEARVAGKRPEAAKAR